MDFTYKSIYKSDIHVKNLKFLLEFFLDRLELSIYPYLGNNNNEIVKKKIFIELYLIVLDRYSNNRLI